MRSARPGRGWVKPLFSVRAVDSCLTTLVAVCGRCNDVWAAVIGSKDARAFLVRGSRLPDALIFSASRPIKHCTKHGPRRSRTQRRGERRGPMRFRGLRLFGLVWPAAEQAFLVATLQLSKVHETLTSAQPARCVSRLQSARLETRDSARSRSLSDPAGEPDLHLALRRSVASMN